MNLHKFPRQVTEGHITSTWLTLSLMGYLPWKPATRLWGRQTSHMETPMQRPTEVPSWQPAWTARHGSEPSSWFRLPAFKLLQVMLSGADVSHPLPQVQIHEQNKRWFFFSTPRGMQETLVSRPGIKLVPPAVEAWSPDHRSTREFPNVVVV